MVLRLKQLRSSKASINSTVQRALACSAVLSIDLHLVYKKVSGELVILDHTAR